MNDKTKDVAVNITYHFASNDISEITADVLVKHEGISLEKAIEFCEVLKKLNEADERLERKETRRHVSLSNFNDDTNPPKLHRKPLSLEEVIVRDEAISILFDIIDKELTPTQKKRLHYHIFENMTEEQIGALEGATHQAISKSILQAIKKIKKFYN